MYQIDLGLAVACAGAGGAALVAPGWRGLGVRLVAAAFLFSCAYLAFQSAVDQRLRGLGVTPLVAEFDSLEVCVDWEGDE
jgi:hypothetical protein